MNCVPVEKVRDAKVETGFTLRQHVDAGSSLGCIRDEASELNRTSV